MAGISHDECLKFFREEICYSILLEFGRSVRYIDNIDFIYVDIIGYNGWVGQFKVTSDGVVDYHTVLTANNDDKLTTETTTVCNPNLRVWCVNIIRSELRSRVPKSRIPKK